jgi:hypothetical protein
MAYKNKDKVFTDPRFIISFNGIELNEALVDSFSVDYSIDSIFPTGELTINDNNGLFFAGFKLSLFSCLSVTVKEANPKSDYAGQSFSLGYFYVVNISSSTERNPKLLQGKVVLKLVHQWAIMQNYFNHAYPAENLSKTIKRVLEDSLRGFIIDYEEDDISISDDLGKCPRYKYNIGDADFIEQKILPYYCSLGEACWAFLNQSNYFNLKSFSKMYSASPSLLYTSDMESLPLDTSSLGSFKQILQFNFEDISIGNSEDLAKNICPKITFDYERAHRIKSMTGSYSIKTDSNSPYFPFDKNYYSSYDGSISGFYTNSKIYKNHFLDDDIALNKFDYRDSIKMFATKGNTNFSTQVEVGDVVYLEVPIDSLSKTDGSTITKEHWMSGKWLVYGICHYTSGGVNKAKSNLVLIRPNFVFKKDDTNITIETNDKLNLASL